MSDVLEPQNGRPNQDPHATEAEGKDDLSLMPSIQAIEAKLKESLITPVPGREQRLRELLAFRKETGNSPKRFDLRTLCELCQQVEPLKRSDLLVLGQYRAIVFTCEELKWIYDQGGSFNFIHASGDVYGVDWMQFPTTDVHNIDGEAVFILLPKHMGEFEGEIYEEE